MCNINYFVANVFFILSLFFFTFSSIQVIYSEEDNEVQYESEILVVSEQCLQLMSSHRAGGNSWQLRFHNICGKRVYANACIEERPGKFKLHKSNARIPEFGYWNIFSHEGSEPHSIHIATSTGVPVIPGQCGIK